MNIFSITGFLIASVVFFAGLRMASANMLIFLDYPSMFIVLGGTFAATAISFQLDRISLILKIFVSHIIGGRKINYKKIIQNIASVSEAYRTGESAEQLTQKAEDPFLREGVQLIADGVLDNDLIIKILEDRAHNMNYKRSEDAKKIKTLGKYPPAFGMMGTTIGMIVLLANLGGEDAIKMIGPAMGVCLITTLYGVVVANLVFIPIAENLIESCKETHVKNLIILEGVKHILIKSNPVLLIEDLNSFLIPSERMDWREIA